MKVIYNFYIGKDFLEFKQKTLDLLDKHWTNLGQSYGHWQCIYEFITIKRIVRLDYLKTLTQVVTLSHFVDNDLTCHFYYWTIT